ncbi:hypothetical protein D187_010139 [Cystobacter fuscus DSM 2262]|uniref:Lipoprotein n=1 Tax=Cystobacter fuscus (strain ATCC 25194 / DSM 2262 / NBRC 100088 / M29) TaxID=1242864 RepID=S9PAU8_CYSF2|nr:hypothetical protein [Cystobacter fuscus]EPX61520.1 hypothetical protein D187_010139 [Cystobacter fuscus DSM 2262]
MKYIMTVVGSLVLGLLVGCGPVEMNEARVSEELVVPADGTVLSPELRDAMLARIPKPSEEMLQAAAVACQPAKTCTGSLSCGNWSPLFNCGTLSTCKASRTECKHCEYMEDVGRVECEYFGVQKQSKNRYRVCFNAAGASCTEYASTASSVCGCIGIP